MKKIIAHTLVKNEENYVWFSVRSVIDYVDKVFVWDTGSSDKTPEIIDELKKEFPEKIYFKEVGDVNINEFTSVRQRMLEATDSDWFILVDGDEVWWDNAIGEVVAIINEVGDKLNSIANRYTNLVGDIYHYQDEAAGGYQIDGERGFLTIRAMNRKIPGLTVGRPHGQQGFFNGEGVLIQEMDRARRKFVRKPVCLHFTNLPRSGRGGDEKVPKRKMKHKFELGHSFSLDFYYPEALFKNRPKIVPDPWVRRGSEYVLRAAVETPLKVLKRNLLPRRSGY